jgi:hypothetical protein
LAAAVVLLATARLAADVMMSRYELTEAIDLQPGAPQGADGRYVFQYLFQAGAEESVSVEIIGVGAAGANPAAGLDGVCLYCDDGDGRWQKQEGDLSYAAYPKQDTLLRFLITTEKPGQTAKVQLQLKLETLAEPAPLVRRVVIAGRLEQDQYPVFALPQLDDATQSYHIAAISPVSTLKVDLGDLVEEHLFNPRNTWVYEPGTEKTEFDHKPAKPGPCYLRLRPDLATATGAFQLLCDVVIPLRSTYQPEPAGN